MAQGTNPGNNSRDWDSGWAALDTTIKEQDVWLLSDRIKLSYLLKRISKDMQSLEVGCGSAKLSTMLAGQGLHTTGVDLSTQGIRAAQRNYAHVGVTGQFVNGDAFRLPFADSKFDLVLSTGLLEHFKNPVPIVAEMARVLKPGGLFFSDIAPLKFSLLRMGFYLRGHHKAIADEYPFNGSDIAGWLQVCRLQNIRVFSSCLVPPLGIIRRVPPARILAFKLQNLWTVADGTWLADWLGFAYLAMGNKAQ